MASDSVTCQAARDKVRFLDHTAVFVLGLCDGLISAAGIKAMFRETFAPAAAPERAVDDILGRFVAEKLKRIDPPPATASSTT